MRYRYARVGGRSWLLTEPDTGAYGNATLNVAMSFVMARHLGARVCMHPAASSRHEALWTLRCDGIHTVAPTPKSWSHLDQVMRRASWLAGGSGRSRPGVRYLDSEDAGGARTRWSRRYFGLDFRREYAERPLGVRFPSALAERLPTLARAAGIDTRRPIVTLHVREGSYKASLGIEDRPKDRVRNASIHDYVPAVDWLVARGYQVVRFGDNLMEPFSRPGVVDLAVSPRRTAALEIWAVQASSFFVASDCGPFNLSILLGVPCLATNMTHLIGGYPLRKSDMYLPKHLHGTVDGRELPLEEMLAPGPFGHRFEGARFRFRDNTPEELLAAVQEMAVSTEEGPTWSPSQAAFRRLLIDWLASDVGHKKATKGGLPPFHLGEGRVADVLAEHLLT